MSGQETLTSMTAIAMAGSKDYNSHPGASLTLLSELALNGQLEAFSRHLLAHVAVHPRDEKRLVDEVPAKIISQFVCGHHRCSSAEVRLWQNQHPEWADMLKTAVSNPKRFLALANDMVRQIQREGIGSGSVT